MQLLQGTIQHYAWGTTDAIPNLLGLPVDGSPYAEYWLGAHQQAPSLVGGVPLDSVIASDPALLGDRSRREFGDVLPFLMKVLSARHALSIQAHPSREQAEAGFARENAAGISLDAPERVYSDDWPKPEILIALDEFETLSGFRDPMTTAALFSALGVSGELGSLLAPLTERKGAAALAQVFLEALSLEGDRAQLIDVVVAAAIRHATDDGPVGEFARTAVDLDAVFPGDRGILAALLMNRVRLQPGEAVYVPAGYMHAHLSGTGVEVMANSDNVIRGGLTPKHVDVKELVTVVGFEPAEPQVLRPVEERAGVGRYPVPCPEFAVWRVSPASPVPVDLPGNGSARILLVVSGELTLHGPESTLSLGQGQSAFVPATETAVSVSGDGLGFVSASGAR
ncbi:MAG: mannose-6-phosphate isomerase, class I [Propionicimonas sp.]|uniref:mannose-6-phosphate isomerase, class I n=1 Tax=Propionicimonas sp. TaxID=1955623 RepID=UPI002B20EFB8|nr:mannose-6-phosphate isomerase, class I [Propionicimonas sp.]MEA4944186.1 mannose-6-phosphate isomerase, class I [Propionicimonas sp.]MEA5052619.1 mannose-6-phosphate isomerase, class I [Propionicimonas sp.]MEA5116597.1 mannose-6-phosphate isomerase, class I [Propionicimonas sp.]